ncbi:histidine phosphatase family protein [Ktedonobacter robiniae]|uniref:Histidine phosphatase family protein n=1 Tax=Ktedonobacter robiniae TaxID=2778365 RepID=A0ABQ3UXT7_9CHLR|nr:hypothetical protein KSB_59490 [Ktedonobacter robiniae]
MPATYKKLAAPHSGESLTGFHLRTCRALDRILREYAGQSIVVVCHGGTVNVSFIYFLGLSLLKYPPILEAMLTVTTHAHPEEGSTQQE